MTTVVVVDKEGRIELPLEIRKRWALSEGRQITLTEEENGSVTLKVGRKLSDLIGMLDGNGVHLTIGQINEVIESKGLET